MSVERLKKALAEDKGRVVQVDLGEYIFEVREPSVGEKARYLDSVGGAKGVENASATQLSEKLMEVVVACVYDPESGERVFDAADIPKLMEGRTLVGKFVNVLTGFMKGDVADAGKESEATGTSAGASS